MGSQEGLKLRDAREVLGGGTIIFSVFGLG